MEISRETDGRGMVTPDGVHHLRVGLSPAIRKLANEGLVKLSSEEKVDLQEFPDHSGF